MTGAASEQTRKKEFPPQLAPFKWQPGVSANPKGRPKGARSKLGEQFVAALQADFEEHGKDVIEKVRMERPQDYLKVLASILPKELNVKVDALGEMTDDELEDTLARLRDLALALDAQIAGAGTDAAREAKPTALLSAVQ